MGLGITKFVDFKGISLSSTSVTIDGIYDAIEGAWGSCIAFCNLNYGGTEKGSAFVAVTVSGTSYVASVFGKTITITSSNGVTIA